jgi:flagellar hook-associated protein 1
VSGLFGSLSMAARALDAQTYGLDVTGQNIANLNTEGYVRRRVNLAEVPPGSGGGVEVKGVGATRDRFIEMRLRTEVPAERREGAIADGLAVVETSLGEVGSSIDGRLTAFFDAFAALASDPTSAVARGGVLLNTRQLASAFNDMSSRFDDAGAAADTGVRGTVEQINALAQRIATLNAAIGSGNGADVEGLKDEQTLALQTLAGLSSITVMARADGGADVAIGNGRALVVGANHYDLAVASGGALGYASISAGGADITADLTSGSLGGLLHVRDTLVPKYKTELDQLAFSVAGRVNSAHAAGFDLNGAPATNLFSPLATATGAAAALAINPAVAADASLIAASSTGATGDNQTAKAIADLRDARVMAGSTNTFSQAWSEIVYHVASDSQTAQVNQKTRQEVVASVTRLRDSVSGVSLDEEAASMLKFQRAYEANARYFASINSALDTLMNIVGV